MAREVAKPTTTRRSGGSSADGFNAYERIGFRTYCTVERYRWRPETGRV